MKEFMYQTLRDRFEEMIREKNLWMEKVQVTVKPPSEAIGTPKREDFPLLKGKERIVEARFKESRGQAFTDAYVQFSGDLKEVLSIDLTNNENRAIFIAAMNAVMNHLGMVEGTTHCKDEEPETCSRELVDYISKNFGDPKIAMIGYQPQMVETLTGRFTIRVTDLNRENIGTVKEGVEILDGEKDLDETVEWSDLVLATGSTIVNGTIERIVKAAGHRPLIFYGITIAGPAKLLGLNRFCMRACA
jgi:uncharacterized protein (DUF4213/DUF364 family)